MYQNAVAPNVLELFYDSMVIISSALVLLAGKGRHSLSLDVSAVRDDP